MIKARFTKEQPEVTVKSIDGKDYFYICLNGETVTDETSEDDSVSIEYDYNEFVVSSGSLDTEAVTADPSSYLNYKVAEETELTVEEQLNDVQLALAELYEMMIGE